MMSPTSHQCTLLFIFFLNNNSDGYSVGMILHGAMAVDSIDPDGGDEFWKIRRSVSISFFMTQKYYASSLLEIVRCGE
jgi:hypothetical protein